MSLDILDSIKQMLRTLQILTDHEIDQLCALLKKYSEGMWIYPGVISRKVPLTIEKTYIVTDALEHAGYIQSYYELYCNNCQKATGAVFETIGELPCEFECELCHASMISIENSILIYKVTAE